MAPGLGDSGPSHLLQGWTTGEVCPQPSWKASHQRALLGPTRPLPSQSHQCVPVGQCLPHLRNPVELRFLKKPDSGWPGRVQTRSDGLWNDPVEDVKGGQGHSPVAPGGQLEFAPCSDKALSTVDSDPGMSVPLGGGVRQVWTGDNKDGEWGPRGQVTCMARGAQVSWQSPTACSRVISHRRSEAWVRVQSHVLLLS